MAYLFFYCCLEHRQIFKCFFDPFCRMLFDFLVGHVKKMREIKYKNSALPC